MIKARPFNNSKNGPGKWKQNSYEGTVGRMNEPCSRYLDRGVWKHRYVLGLNDGDAQKIYSRAN